MSNIDHQNSAYTYNQVASSFNATLKGSDSVTGVSNYYWNGQTIQLNQDARYEISFNINVSGTNPMDHKIPTFNFYLAANQNSLLYGNYFDVTSIGVRGPAGVFHYKGDVSNGDTRAAGMETYILNSDVRNIISGAKQWYPSTKVSSACGTESILKDGHHTYSIYIETFADSSKADYIKFTYSGVNGTGWTEDFNLNTISGINPSHDSIKFGYFSDADGAYLNVDQVSYKKYTRTLIETTPTILPVEPSEPQPEPSVPEPSAFGLLAGLGAIALAVSRRRRSR